MMVNVDSRTAFENEIFNSQGIVYVGFTADWCPYCKVAAPFIQKFIEQHQNIKFCRADVDKIDNIDEQLNVMTIPTIAIFKDGKMIDSLMVARLSESQIFEFLAKYC